MLQIQTYPFYSYLAALITLTMMLSAFAVSAFYHLRKKRIRMKTKTYEDECGMEADRKRIAADLHDDFGSLLNGLQLSFQTLAERDPSNTFFASSLERLDKSIHRLREISLNLMPHELESEGICAAIESLAERINNSKRITAHFQCAAVMTGFDLNKTMLLFRVIQEITTNTIKHSGATNLWIGMAVKGYYLILEIKDDGCGFDYERSFRKKGSSGLKNLQSRLDLLSALLMIETNRINGTHYFIKIPLRQLRNGTNP